MLYFTVSTGLLVINFILGFFLVIKTKRSFTSLFYLLCICLLFAFGSSNYILNANPAGLIKIVNEYASLLLFSMTPFFFLNFVVLFIGFNGITKTKLIIGGLYFTGILIFSLFLLNMVPKPLMGFSSSSTGIFSFLITWLALFLSIGISYTSSILNPFSEKKFKTDFILAGLGFLIIFLPGPLSEAILHYLFKQSDDWYFFSSIIALVISIYFVFRNKSILALYDSLRIALESIDDLMLNVNKEFKIVMARGAFQKLSGFSENELLGLYLDQIIDQKDIIKNYRNSVGEGKIKEANFDLTLIKKNRNFRYMNFSFTPIFNQGMLTGYVCMGRDISERRAAEEELRREYDSLEVKIQQRTTELAKANEELQKDITQRKKTEKELITAREKADEANRLKFSLLANLSHELRTPMIGIMGMAEILKTEAKSAEHVDYTNSIINSAQRLMTTLDKLMSLSQLESGSLELNNKRLNFAEITADEIENFRQRAAEKNISISIKAKNDQAVQIFVDERVFRQTIANLIDNAIKFTNKGGIVIETDSSIDKGSLWAYIHVIDSGIGISKENLSLIFEEFRQGSEGNQRSFEGSGLGLTLVKKMLDLSKGNIAVKSEVGKGSVFSLRYPGVLVNKEISDLKDIKTASVIPEEKQDEGSLKEILFVEDNSIQAKLISKFLEEVAVIDFAEDAYSAVYKAKKKNYAAIFINTELPLGMNGVELMSEIRTLSQYNKIPVVAVTKDLGSHNRELIIKGFTSYFLKPFEKGELIKFVSDTIK